jgi:hypothetical protein
MRDRDDILANYAADFKVTPFDPSDIKTIPIIINNYNILCHLDRMIGRLRALGYSNIYVIDNKSTYKPLKKFYEERELKVFWLDKNVGYMALWQTEIGDLFIRDYYAYSDPDIVPDERCPDDFMQRFMNFLTEYRSIDKVGFGLRIDNLPEHYKLREEVIHHERKFWTEKISDGLFNAKIDTTFALYRPGAKGQASVTSGARTDFPYVAEHLPWYVDHNNLSKEERYYLNCKKVYTHWSNHPGNFSFLKRNFLLLKRDKSPFIWNLRSFAKKIFPFLKRRDSA